MGTPDLTVHVTDRQLSALAKGVNLNEICAAIPELDIACKRKIDAAEDFSNLVKLVALKAGINAPVLATYVTAVCQDTLEKKQNQTEQLQLLFDELSP